MNAASAVLLVSGWICIARRRVVAHQICMVAAFVLSLAFLISYIAYHVQVGSVRFQGQGWIRPVYFTILVSHTILAVVIVPLAVRTLWLAACPAARGTSSPAGMGPARSAAHPAARGTSSPAGMGPARSAAHRRFERHRALGRLTLPLWLYVSVTGVVVYLMLYHLR